MEIEFKELSIKLSNIIKQYIITPFIDELKEDIIFIKYFGKKIKYKLKKENKFTDSIVIFESETLKNTRKQQKIIHQKKQKEIEDTIYEFLIKLSPLLSVESKKIVIKNLTNIQDKSNIFNSIMQHFGHSLGEYSPRTHTIRINTLINPFTKKEMTTKEEKEEIKQTLIHELLHASSTYVSPSKYQYFTGFEQTTLYSVPIQNIGKAINEGYTEVITKRLLSLNSIPISPFEYHMQQKDYDYFYFEGIANIIELIVGKEKMMKLYFHSDLKGLINELSKYKKENDIKQFIIDLDFLLKRKNNNQQQINRISEFLDDILISKANTIVKVSSYSELNDFLIQQYFDINEEQRNILFGAEIVFQIKEGIENNISAIYNYNVPKDQKKKVKTKSPKPNGYINILAITIILSSIIILSILLSFLILKVD